MTRQKWGVPGQAALLALAAGGALYLAAPPNGYAADKGNTAPKAAESAPVFAPPADAVAFASVGVGDLWTHPAVKAWRAKAGKELPEPFQEIRTHFGVAADDIGRATWFQIDPMGTGNPLAALTTLKPYDQKAVLAAAAPGAKVENVNGRSYYENPNGAAVCFLDDRTFLIGRPDNLQAYLKRPEGKKEGPLTPALKLLSDGRLVVVGVDVVAIAKTAPPANQFPPNAKPLLPLLKTQLAVLTVDLDDQLKAEARLTFANEGDAKEGVSALDAGLDLVRGVFGQGVKQFSKAVESPKLTAILEDVQAAMKAAKAEQKGAAVEVAAALKIDPDATTAALTEAIPKLQAAARRQLLSNDLKQLALAIHAYNDSYGQMPALAIYDKNGKPLLSWRVAILPYIEQGNLYSQFKLDEPWDSDHNKKLLEKMPPQYAPPESQAYKDHETFFQVFVGQGAAFESPAAPRPGPNPNGLRFPVDFTDGTSNTILIVEAAKSVPWTKPDDIPFSAGKLLPKVGGQSKGGFLAALCDGSVRFFPATIKEDNLRAWVTRNAGDVNEDPDK